MFEKDHNHHQEIRESVRRLSRSEIPKYQSDEHYGRVALELFHQFAELGLTALSIDEEYGGTASSPVLSAIVMEEISSVDLGPAIFLGVHNMVSGLINTFGSDAQKKAYLPDLACGSKLAAFCLTEANAGSDAASLRTQAVRDGDDFILSGEKCWITSAGFADLYLVFARTTPEGGKSGISAFLVPKEAQGLSFGIPEKKMGCELSPIATVQMDRVKVPSDAMLGKLDQGYNIALGGLAGGRINIAASALGLSRSAIDISLSYLEERRQFGQTLVEFQGLQFMLADMKMQFEAAQLLTWRAAKLLEQKPDDRGNRLHPSIAKCFATDAAMKITTDAVQLLGGAGYVKEYQVERLMRDAKMLQIVEGTNQIQRSVIVKEMRLRHCS